MLRLSPLTDISEMSIQMWFRTKWARTVCFFERVLFVPVPCRPADPKLFPGNTFPDLLDYFRRDLFRTTFLIAWFLPGYCFACSSAFFDHPAFELCKTQRDISSIYFQKNNGDIRMLYVSAQSYSQTVFIQKKIK